MISKGNLVGVKLMISGMGISRYICLPPVPSISLAIRTVPTGS
jgi:hypothetical protein